jgi:RNA polymerase sigma factor
LKTSSPRYREGNVSPLSPGRENEETERHAGMNLDESAEAIRAAKDERAREELIRRQEKNILRIASRAKRRFVTKSDDEWSIALYAFSRAIDTYDSEKGKFLPYAERLIRNGLIDASRAGERFRQEIAVPPEAFEGEGEEDNAPVRYAVVQNSVRAADTRLKEEIRTADEALRAFGFGFYELADASPEQKRTRAACRAAAQAVLDVPEETKKLFCTHRLPAQLMKRKTGVPEKTIEKYRRYIVALVVIVSGDFPLLAGYLGGGKRGEEEI